jgi:hypothetical protein
MNLASLIPGHRYEDGCAAQNALNHIFYETKPHLSHCILMEKSTGFEQETILTESWGNTINKLEYL